MFNRIQLLSLAAAGALVALTVANTPTHADELLSNLGPVGPHEPILTTVGSKRIIAFYVPDTGSCAVNAVVWEKRCRYRHAILIGTRSGQPNTRTDLSYRQHWERVDQSPMRRQRCDSRGR
jgi:hypothetical protein